MSNRGNLLDVLLVPIIVFIFFFTTVLAVFVWNRWDDAFTPKLVAAGVDTGFVSKVDNTFLIFDYAGILVYMGLTLASVISAYFIETHPLFFGLSITLLAIFVLIAAILSNVFSQVLNGFAEAGGFPKLMYIINNLPLFTAVSGALIILALYGKPSRAYVAGGGRI